MVFWRKSEIESLQNIVAGCVDSEMVVLVENLCLASVSGDLHT